MKKALLLMLKNPRLLAYAVFSDFMFIITYLFFSSALRDKALEYTIAAGSLTAKSSPEMGRIVGSSQTLIGALSSVQGVRPFLIDLMILGIILIVAMFILYVFFQGISWFIAGRLQGKKVEYYGFIMKFIKLNAIWLIAFVLFDILRFIIGFGKMVSQRPYSGDMFSFGIVIPILGLILGYFMISSYTSLYQKKGLGIKAGLHDVKRKVIRFIFLLGIIAVIHILQVIIFRATISVTPLISGIFFILVELPTFTLARVYFLEDK